MQCVPRRPLSERASMNRWIIFGIAGAGGLLLSLSLLVNDHVLENALDHFYHEDGFFEYLSAILWVCGSVFMFLAASKLIGRKRRFVVASPGYRLVGWSYVAIGSAFLFIGMEEISWGQRLLGLEVPAYWRSINRQSELNLHNLLDSARLLHILCVVPAILTMISVWLELRQSPPRFFNMLLPNSDLIVLGMLLGLIAMTLGIGPRTDELLEEMAALFAFCYSCSVLTNVREFGYP